MKKLVLIILMTFSLASCSGLYSSLGSDTIQSQEVVAETATVTSTADTRQVSNQSQGSSSVEKVEGGIDSIVTNNGFSGLMVIIAIAVVGLLFGVIFGILIPQPKFIKLLW